MRFVLGGRYGLAPQFGRRAPGHAVCSCGHERDVHEHLRRGMDCGSCGRDICRAYTRARRANVVPLHQRPGRAIEENPAVSAKAS